MILFFGKKPEKIFAVQVLNPLAPEDADKLSWLFGNQPLLQETTVQGPFVGPRAAMISPWSTNAVEITQNMAIGGILRIEEFTGLTGTDSQFGPHAFTKIRPASSSYIYY